MKPHELKAKLGRFAGLLLYPAYSRLYWRQALLKDSTVQPERLKAIIDSAEEARAELNNIIKELQEVCK
jgi:hypothetical protein